MPTYDNSYSRLVAWLKVILPLLALGLLSTLFLISRSVDPSKLVPFADAEIQEIARKQGIGSPTYSSVSKNGSAIIVTADNATPDPSDSTDITAKNLKAIVEAPDGDLFTITAPDGHIISALNTAELAGGVRIVTSDGLQVDTETAVALLDLTEISASSTITAVGPFGDFTAGKMVLTQQSDPASDGSYVLVFTDGVNLIYDPKK